MLPEENSRDNSESYNFSETLTRNLSKLSISAGTTHYAKTGWQDCVRYIIIKKLQREREEEEEDDDDNNTGFEETQGKSRSKPFRCRCNFCVLYKWDPSENAKIGM
nr:developmental pluripotency-associated protein 3-like [Microcebus murinus]